MSTADCNAKVKEYSMKVFVPLGYSINENELEVIFPDVSFGVKMKIKNSKLIGHNYILSSENKHSFINLMSEYIMLIESDNEEERKVPVKRKQNSTLLLQVRLIDLVNEEYKPTYAIDITEMILGFEIETEFEDIPKKLEAEDWRSAIFHATELASGRDFSIENANKLKLPSDELVKLMNEYFY